MRRTHFQRRLVAGFAPAALAAALTVAIAVPRPGHAQEVKKGGTLNVAIETDMGGFDAAEAGAAGQTDQTVMRVTMEPLLSWNPETNEPGPWLATEWSQNEDGTIWTFKLRDDVKFHDGSPLTAEDVAYHYNRVLDPEMKARARTYVSAVEKAVAVDDHTVEVHLKHPWAALIPYVASYTMFGPIPSKANTEAGKQQREPVGTGPFKLVEWRSGDRMIFEKFDDYWGADEINLDQIIFRVLPQNQTRYASLQSGEVDVIWTDRGPTIVDAQGRDDIVSLSAEGSGAATVLLNGNEGKKLANDNLRHALAHAWNQDALVKISWQNTRPSVEHPLGANADCGDVRYREFNIEKAKELLAKYKEETGTDEVKLVMIHTTTPRGREYGEIYQQTAKAAGIELDLQPVDQTTLVKRVLGGDFDISGYRITERPDLGPSLFSYTQPDSSYNLTGFDNPELTELGKKMRVETDFKTRLAMQCEMAALMNDDARILYRGGGKYYAFTRPEVNNVPTPYGGVVDVTRAWIDK